MGEQWYCNRGSQRFGPFSPAQLKQLARDGKLRPTDLLWKEGMSQAVPAQQAGALFPNAAAEKKSAGDEASSTRRPATSTTRTSRAAASTATDAPPVRRHTENEDVEFTYRQSMRKLIVTILVIGCAAAFMGYLALFGGLRVLGIALPDEIGKPILWAVVLFLILALLNGTYFFIRDRSHPRKIVLGRDWLMAPQTNFFNRASSIPYDSITDVQRREFNGTSTKVLIIKHAEGKVELASGLLPKPADLDTIQAMLEQRLQRR
jgi:hypothetical protein